MGHGPLVAQVTPGVQEGVGQGDKQVLWADSFQADSVSYDDCLFTGRSPPSFSSELI